MALVNSTQAGLNCILPLVCGDFNSFLLSYCGFSVYSEPFYVKNELLAAFSVVSGSSFVIDWEPVVKNEFFALIEDEIFSINWLSVLSAAFTFSVKVADSNVFFVDWDFWRVCTGARLFLIADYLSSLVGL